MTDVNKIKLLDNSTINKIAAGEVVERPSSVVKELVENSIDAGSSAITIEIKDGGTTFIRISDNGCGIPEEEVKTAFLRHATSKIKTADDLETVFSLGFRGEALASIAAVSKAEMVTKTRDSEIGTKIRINGGILEEIRSEGAADGTSITIEDIFYNVPARKKFLKKPSTESGYISDVINKFVLGHPEISFKYINNGNIIIHTSGNNDLKTAVYHVYGKETAFKMLEISAKTEEMEITGLIGRPELSRANRNYENLFINGRFIKNSTVSAAAEEAYKTRLMIGKFPVYILSMKIEPSMVDVNVHPAKLEVRFRDEDAVYKFIYDSIVNNFNDKVLIKNGDWESKPSTSVKELINSPETIVKPVQQDIFEEKTIEFPESEVKPLSIREEAAGFIKFDKTVSDSDRKIAEMLIKGEIIEEEPAFVSKSPEIEYKQNEENTFTEILPEHLEFVKKIQEKVNEENEYIKNSLNENDFDKEAEIIIDEPEEFSQEKPFFDNYKIIGQIFSTYWIIEQNSSIFIIDQHAAHERVLFEKFSEEFKNGKIVSQDLLAQEHLVLSEIEKEILRDNIKSITDFGFGVIEKDGEFYINSVPYLFDKPATSSFLMDILDTIKTNNIKSIYDTKILNLATMACKAAVKGGDNLKIEETEELIKNLLSLKNPFSCPHGRPTIIEMTEYELEKKFKRIQ